jgi:hypothetical protein
MDLVQKLRLKKMKKMRNPMDIGDADLVEVNHTYHTMLHTIVYSSTNAYYTTVDFRAVSRHAPAL